MLRDFQGAAAQDLQLQTRKCADELDQRFDEERDRHRLRKGERQRCDAAGLERGGELLGGQGAVEALLQQGEHPQPELGHVGEIALAPEEVAAELRLEELDGTRERGLRDVALLGRPREVEDTRDGQEVADLVHLQGAVFSGAAGTFPIRRHDTRS